MKITKFVHACLLVEMPEPVNRTVLFDPGDKSGAALDIEALEFLDDIVITHMHPDHFDIELVKKIVAKFPHVRITTTAETVTTLGEQGITASNQPAEGLMFFESPHEIVRPFMDADPPQEIGVHYLEMLSHPGDSHGFHETKPILALPVQAPWGSLVDAVNLAFELQPKHILPIHDWHWSDEARSAIYDRLEIVFAEQGIVFHKLQTGQPIVIDV